MKPRGTRLFARRFLTQLMAH